LLAQSYEEAKEYDRAIDRYRKVLAVNPNEPIALNNLAYALAVRRGQPAEAVGYAEVRLHAAVVDAAIGLLEPAAKELGEALRLDPTLAANSDVKPLQARLARR
jgi:tetratricopeptide (TPR) repeat protein